MIYTGGTHIVADSEEELHEYAVNVLGLKRKWYQNTGRALSHPHYDVISPIKKRILKNDLNVAFVRPREVLCKSKQMLSGIKEIKVCSSLEEFFKTPFI